MAENLNTPADFEKSKPKAVNVNLLPPSAFGTNLTKKKEPDPWKEIAKASEEMVQLKLENSRLREAQQRLAAPVDEMALKPAKYEQEAPVCKYPSRKEDLRYIDELINKQASEISDLKKEIQDMKSKHKDEVTELERELTRKERDFHHNVTTLETDLRAAENRYDMQVDRLSREHERETDDLNHAIQKLEEDLTQVRVRSAQQLEDLEVKYGQLAQTSQEKITDLTHQMRSKESLVESQLNQINSLKKYIGETEHTLQSKTLNKKEKDSISAKLKQLEEEKQNLGSTIQLLNIRLNSMNEILHLQESEISKSSSDTDKSKQEGLLLTRWREKVFALMVQQKSTAIVSKKDDNNWKAKIEILENKLSSAQNQIQQLTHNLSDKDAQLNMERISCQKLQSELSEAQQLALCLDDQIQTNVQHIQALHHASDSVQCKFQENCEVFNSAMSNIKAFGQRITFASGRIDMLQGLFARKEAMLKLQLENANVPEKDEQEPVLNKGEDQTFLARELEIVTKERDNLASQIKLDSQSWDEKVFTIKKQFQDEIEDLKRSKADLEQIVKDKSQKYEEECEKSEMCESDLQYATQNIEELKATLAKQEMNMEQLLDEQRREVENQSADQFADKDRQLNEAKREHAKAVVSLRQLERQSAREKERMTEHLNTVEDYYKGQIEKMDQHMKSLEKERNIMMATLRQEGLIGKLKSERSQPITANWDELRDTEHDENIPVRDMTHTTPRTFAPSEPFIMLESTEAAEGTEPITSVLEDIQSLTDAVLKDDDDNTDSASEGEG